MAQIGPEPMSDNCQSLCVASLSLGLHTGDQALEERLGAQVLVVLLEVLLGWGDELDGSELEATLLKAGDDVADESTLDTIWLDGDEAGAVSDAVRCH